MTKSKQQPRERFWKRMLSEPPPSRELMMGPNPVFLACSVVAPVAGAIGWTMASIYPGWIVAVCSVVAILAGLLGVRSRWRSLGVTGFVMGMFLLPHAIGTVVRLFST